MVEPDEETGSLRVLGRGDRVSWSTSVEVERRDI